jgi:nitrite reductase/ring-hydroxylating ferredoxin subunit
MEMAEFVEVVKSKDLKPGNAKVVTAKKKEYALYNVDGKFFSTENLCPHEECLLGEGSLDGKAVICPCHGSTFDVTTGELLEGPAKKGIKTYEVKVKDGKVFIKV